MKLLDYQQQWETLEQSSNPFALLVMAHLKTHATRGQAEEREAWKWNLVGAKNFSPLQIMNEIILKRRSSAFSDCWTR